MSLVLSWETPDMAAETERQKIYVYVDKIILLWRIIRARKYSNNISLMIALRNYEDMLHCQCQQMLQT